MAKKELTEMQQKFLDVLFAEAKGDIHKAKEMAGYSENSSVYQIMSPIQEEIGQKLKESLGTTASINAYKNLLSVLDGNDDPLGRKERIQVARDLLDRAGFDKTEKVEVKSDNSLFILPAKENAKDI